MASTTCTTYLGVATLALLSAVAASVLMAVVFAGPAQAATFTVTTTDDEQNADAQCSLRETTINANENDQSGSADCAAGVGENTINFDLEDSLAIVTLASQLLTITDSTQFTIGGGSANITASGNEQVSMREVSIDTITFKIFKAGEDSARKATVTYEEATLRGGDRQGHARPERRPAARGQLQGGVHHRGQGRGA